ncbi:putative baseplate assembly protein [Streptomyces zaomyceticus]|uniref:putative baseplate assembly protein n=1 Tax=Streptomyces zaomyceticus TaxID=68286 RepID=UPI00341D197D
MPLVPPVLDSRRWPDLVDAARSLIPLFSPEWTDENVSDPGIALLEALAWQADADLYRASRVTERHRLKHMALLGFDARGPRAASTVLTVRADAARPRPLPAGIELTAVRAGTDRTGAVGLTTLAAVRPTGRSLVTVGVDRGDAEASGYETGWTDRTADARTGLVWAALGPDPAPGAALVLGLDGPLPAGAELSLHLALGGPGPDDEPTDPDAEPLDPAHHDAVTVWEARSGGAWQRLPDAAVVDETRALTRPGAVRLAFAQDVAVTGLGRLPERAWLRCRLERGRHDTAPALGRITVDAVPAALSRPAFGRYTVAAGVTASGTVPPPPGRTRMALTTDEDGLITGLRVGGSEHEGPSVRVLEWRAPHGELTGRLSLEAVVAGRGDGTPEQRFRVPVEGQVFTDTAEVWLCAPDLTARQVTLVPDLDASGRADRHAVFDPWTAELRFGDGRRGAVPERGDTVLVCCAADGVPHAPAVGPATPVTLDAGVRNAALLGDDPPELAFALAALPAGGSAAEDSAAVAARVERVLWAHERVRHALAAARSTSLDDLDRDAVRRLPVPERAVTLGDFERCALAVPGTRVARARAFAALDPRLPGCHAAGCVTVVVVPGLPASRPEPTPGLLRAVRGFLAVRRTVGTRVFVVGPRYLEVSVNVTVTVVPESDPAVTQRAVVEALDGFLDPLTGGPAGGGWPFGRDVYRGELLGVLDAVPGVAHVTALTMTPASGPASRTGLRVPPDTLVTAGEHTVHVLPGSGR